MLIRHVPRRPDVWLYPHTLLDMRRPPRPRRPASPQQHISERDVTVYPLALAMGRNSRLSLSRMALAPSASGRSARGLISMLIFGLCLAGDEKWILMDAYALTRIS